MEWYLKMINLFFIMHFPIMHSFYTTLIDYRKEFLSQLMQLIVSFNNESYQKPRMQAIIENNR